MNKSATDRHDAPVHSKYTRKRTWWHLLLSRREVILRREESVKFFSFSIFSQAFILGAAGLFIGWVVYASIVVFSVGGIIEAKEQKAQRAENTYRYLLAEVAVYQQKFDEIARRLETASSSPSSPASSSASSSVSSSSAAVASRSSSLAGLRAKHQIAGVKIMSKPKSGEEYPSDALPPSAIAATETTEAPSVLTRIAETFTGSKHAADKKPLDKDKMVREISLLSRKMAATVEETNWADVSGGDLEIKFQEASLQRDIAVSENTDLRNKIKELETLVTSMQDVQFAVFERMSSLAEGGVQTIESNLSNIRGTLSGVGLTIDNLLSRSIRLRSKSEVLNDGQGGPFVPIKADLKNSGLNTTLVSLNRRINKWENLADLQDQLPLGKPVDKIKVTSRYGSRVDPFTGDEGIHDGLDLGGRDGDKIYVTAPGKVLRAGNYGLYGNLVEVEHTLGFRTRYAHLSKVMVKKGEWVDTGDIVGLMGSTGRSTGNHLHYEIRVNNRAINPTTFVRTRKDVFKN